MNIQLKTVFGDLIIEGDFSCIADAVESALAAKKSLSYADLRSANLRSANLSSANLSSANLRSANLSYANLSYADLRSANLRSANLRSANLSSANLSSANLRSANLSYAKNSALAIAQTRILPEGDLIGYKKTPQGIVQLRIPEQAKRSHAFGRKCRAEFALVLAAPDGAVSSFDGKTAYKAGEIVKCDKWCEDFTNECAGGIHFFITKEEAEAYSL
jgi:hypothetical protein